MRNDIAERDEQVRSWWVFYPCVGLDVTDEDLGLQQPMFGDATLISRSHIPQITSAMSLDVTQERRHDYEEALTWILRRLLLRDDCHSFVAVRRSGPMPRGHDSSLLISAEARARKVVSALSLLMLAESKSMVTCGLGQQMMTRDKKVLALSFGSSMYHLTAHGRESFTAMSHVDVWRPARAEILAISRAEPYAPLMRCLLGQRRAVATTLDRALTSSAIRLSDSLHTADRTSQLLGAVTAVEILLTDMSEGYDALKNRMRVLLGSEAVAQYHLDQVLQARHLYVHKGEQVEDYYLRSDAVLLGLLALLEYARLAPRYTSKSSLLRYLDLAVQCDDFLADCTKDQRATYGKLARPTPVLPALPCMHRFIKEASVDAGLVDDMDAEQQNQA